MDLAFFNYPTISTGIKPVPIDQLFTREGKATFVRVGTKEVADYLRSYCLLVGKEPVIEVGPYSSSRNYGNGYWYYYFAVDRDNEQDRAAWHEYSKWILP